MLENFGFIEVASFQTGDGLEKVPVGRQATFFIEGQMEMGDPEVKVLSPLRKIVPSSIR